MEKKPRKPGTAAKPAPTTRDERLKAALKANIARRKLQARERAEDPADGDNTKT